MNEATASRFTNHYFVRLHLGNRNHRVLIEVAAIACLVASQVFGVEPLADRLDSGEAIFSHRWQTGESAGSGGDGLGPMHNDVSCVACHFLGGIGGAGGLEKNAILLSLDPGPNGTPLVELYKHGNEIHPGLMAPARPPSLLSQVVAMRRRGIELGDEMLRQMETRQRQRRSSLLLLRFNTMLVLHKQSTDPEYASILTRFAELDSISVAVDRQQDVARQMAVEPVELYVHSSGLRFLVSQRNTSALFGAGLIDNVPDQYLQKLAAEQRDRGLVSGRPARTSFGNPGKFGWKGQTASLDEFVRGACANELGLQVPGADQPMTPTDKDYVPAGFDLEETQVTSLTSFVASLPPPRVLTPDDENVAAIAKRGDELFNKVGCAECHVQDLGSAKAKVIGIYSDLLLHDMGPNLADPITPGGSRGGGYYGGNSTGIGSAGLVVSADIDVASPMLQRQIKPTPETGQQEWRTPPLWGVSASAPYLHDGRAATLTEAILYHGGEARFSVKRFLQLAPRDRVALIDFLNTLVPPSAEEI